MINPTTADIGRAVRYRDYAGEVEEGVITSFNADFVFVRYGSELTSKATSRRQLDWTFGWPGDTTPPSEPDEDVLAASVAAGFIVAEVADILTDSDDEAPSDAPADDFSGSGGDFGGGGSDADY